MAGSGAWRSRSSRTDRRSVGTRTLPSWTRVAGLRIKTTEKGVRVGMDLFGGEIEEELEEISGRRVIGCIETVKLIGKDGKEIEVKAKIDTGADSSSIDFELGRQLGFGETVDAYQKIARDWSDISHLGKEARWEMFENIPDVVGTVPITSSHGTTYRVKIPIEIIMDTLRFPSHPTLIDRSKLEYQMIIGRKNLRKFLIDVNK
jgi:hypothetical protein